MQAPDRNIVALSTALFLAGSSLGAQTHFQTGFEASNGHTSGSMVIGVQNSDDLVSITCQYLSGTSALAMTASSQ